MNNEKNTEDDSSKLLIVDKATETYEKEQQVIEQSEPVAPTPLSDSSSLSDTYKLKAVGSKSKKPSTKKLLIGLSVLLLLVGGAFGVYVYTTSNKDSSEITTDNTTQVARLGAAVSVIDGRAQYSDDGESWRDLVGNESLREGQYVRTDATSRVVLVLDDGSAVRLNNSTSVLLQSLLSDDVRVVNVNGEVYARVVPSERQFNVTAAEVDYTAKGTAYKTVNIETQKGVVVYQSTVGVSKTSADVTEGKQYYELHPNKEIVDKITDVPVEELKNDAFAKWNLELDKQASEFKDNLGFLAKIEEPAAATPEPTTTPQPAAQGASITLTGNATSKGIYFSWTTTGLNTKDGFKLVRSTKSQSPTYGKDSADYIKGESTREYTAAITDGKTYYFRLCRYTSSTCDIYSNVVQATAPYVAPEPVQPGGVVLSNSGDSISWTFSGTAPHGFKILLAKTTNPTTVVKVVDKNTLNFNLSGKLTSGDNYIKVCKYTGDDKVTGGITDCSSELVISK